jgi:hypothetical protein
VDQEDSSSSENERIDSIAMYNPGSSADNVIFRLPVAHDDLVTAFTRYNLLPKNDHIVVSPEIDRRITTQCFLALSYTYFGVKHYNKDITQSGLQKYGQSLSVLNNALADDDVSRSFDVLEAIMIMALIEVFSHIFLPLDKTDTR